MQAFTSNCTLHEGDSGRTAMYFRRRFGDIVQLMKETVVLIHKTNVTKLHIGVRFVYRKSHSQCREGFDINVLVIGLIGGHGDTN